jgi:hypothetical protein
LKIKDKQDCAISTVAFISCRVILRVKLTCVADWGSVEREGWGGF